ncbi:MAG: oligopeptide transporter, OPT family [Armatimonadetes bacterium]|nr:oligopeptide transporter, OPT family [Armatimonadota bacterium]
MGVRSNFGRSRCWGLPVSSLPPEEVTSFATGEAKHAAVEAEDLTLRVADSDVSGDEYVPYVPAEQKVPEFTFQVLVLGIFQAVFFGLADGYLGLKIGLTVSASIPAAVISMAILRGLLKRGTILENNLVQNMASVGESLAAGAVFTIPALYILQDFLQKSGQPDVFSPNWYKAFFIACFGGIMGILFMIPLRRYLIVREHGRLRYPEGTACAEVLMAGDEGGQQARTVFAAVGISGLYRFLMDGLRLWNYEVSWPLWKAGADGMKIGLPTYLSFEMLPSLLAVGFIIGLRTCGIMLAGAALGWFVIIPLVAYFGQYVNTVIPPATAALNTLGPNEIYKFYLRYIGAGAVAMGGIVSLVKALPIIIDSFRSALGEMSSGGAAAPVEKKRTMQDIPLPMVLGGAAAIFLIVSVFKPVNPSGFLGGFLAVVFAFFFVTVSSRIVGIVGSTSMPLSGMTIGALLATCLILKAFGWGGSAGMAAALVIASLVCIAISMGGDISQDLKIGFLVGATPRWVQITQLIAVVVSSLTVALIVQSFSPGVVAGEFKAPQANLMFLLTRGIMEGQLPWLLVITGMGIALCVEMMGIGSLPFAIGLYLPLSLSTTIVFGGLIHWGTMSLLPKIAHKAANDKGLLAASGMVAGDALVGVGLGLMMLIPEFLQFLAQKLSMTIPALLTNPSLWNPSLLIWGQGDAWFVGREDLSNIVTCGLFAMLCVYLWKSVMSAGREASGGREEA